MRGGNFKSGYMSAFFAKLSGGIDVGEDDWVQGVFQTLVGGTASEIGGGKFANGAVSAAVVYLFNDSVKAKQAFNAATRASKSTTSLELLKRFGVLAGGNYAFDSEHPMTIDLKNDPRIKRAISLWRNKFYLQQDRYPTNGDFGKLEMGIFFPIQKGGANLTLQFIGSYSASIYFTGGNNYTIYVYNSTSWKSALYHLIPDYVSNRMNSIQQHYMWDGKIK